MTPVRPFQITRLSLLSVLILVLCGCGPSAEEVARRQAREKFRESVVALKVCVERPTYNEFRTQSAAFKRTLALHQASLPDSIRPERTLTLLDACDTCWRYEMEHLGQPVTASTASSVELAAIREIYPDFQFKPTLAEAQKDIDSYPSNCVNRALILISVECDRFSRALDPSTPTR